MKLRKCQNCKTYTLKDSCPKCDSKTSNAHYKFLKFFERKLENYSVPSKH
ncbi:hypothetical protein J4407_03550 [Candidatus Pacearchaeota archaeon]|nr:hypothetical protein [Candidatus Pacearchaeota archaeon]